MTVARRVRYWSGPRTTVDGLDASDTVQRAFQKLLKQYNSVGEGLLAQMKQFPEEIAQGFAECNPTRAETLRANALMLQAKLKNLLEVAGILGLYFPGSPMWERKRKLRTCGYTGRADSFWDTFRMAEWGVVSSMSMRLYTTFTDVDDAIESDSGRAFDVDDPRSSKLLKQDRKKKRKMVRRTV